MKINQPKNELFLNSKSIFENNKAKDTFIYNLIKKRKLVTELKMNYLHQKSKDTRNLKFFRKYLFIPYAELPIGLTLIYMIFRKKLTVHKILLGSCAVAITNELFKNYEIYKTNPEY